MTEHYQFDVETPAIGSGVTTVSGLLDKPGEASALIILGHGAGAGMEHAHMAAISELLNRCRIATFRYQFPYKELGKARTDGIPVCLNTISAALNTTKNVTDPGLPLLLGGHSFGGRMSSHFAATGSFAGLAGLIYFSFPLHNAGRPETRRGEHLQNIKIPQLFVSGDRDKMAELSLLEPLVRSLPAATLETLETADHGFKILKRTRKNPLSVYEEAQGKVDQWLNRFISTNQ